MTRGRLSLVSRRHVSLPHWSLPSSRQVGPTTTSAATSASGFHVSLRGTATSADWVPLAYVAATSAADVEIAKNTSRQARTRVYAKPSE
ncbi:hypothetical protein Tco_0482414 [Tanacetum coccineum]